MVERAFTESQQNEDDEKGGGREKVTVVVRSFIPLGRRTVSERLAERPIRSFGEPLRASEWLYDVLWLP